MSVAIMRMMSSVLRPWLSSASARRSCRRCVVDSVFRLEPVDAGCRCRISDMIECPWWVVNGDRSKDRSCSNWRRERVLG